MDCLKKNDTKDLFVCLLRSYKCVGGGGRGEIAIIGYLRLTIPLDLMNFTIIDYLIFTVNELLVNPALDFQCLNASSKRRGHLKTAKMGWLQQGRRCPLARAVSSTRVARVGLRQVWINLSLYRVNPLRKESKCSKKQRRERRSQRRWMRFTSSYKEGWRSKRRMVT